MDAERRPFGPHQTLVSPVAMGCWPIAGMTTLDATERDSVATLEAALAHGINFFDTAYCYGADGLSERLIGRVFKGRREQIVVASKGGIHWRTPTDRVQDASPARLQLECEESLRRLGVDYIDLHYLHAPDGKTPVASSAAALRRLMEQGKVRAVGASNVSLQQLEEFAGECPVAAVQPPYNMLQREIESDILPWCRQRNIAVMIYWPLMKGLLAGQLPRDHQFPPGDSRRKYPMFQGMEWQKNQDFVDRLKEIAHEAGKTVAQVVINWTIHQSGITVALCGAKRAYQIEESAGAMGWKLSADQMSRIEKAIAERGPIVSRAPV